MVKADYVEDARDARQQIVDTFDKNAEIFDPPPHLFHVFGRRLVELAALKPGERVLDLGVGKGNVLLETLAPIGAEGHATGIDFSPEMIARLDAILAGRGITNVSTAVMESEKTSFPDASFDCVLAGSAVCFTRDLDAQLAEIHRLLKPGGRAAIWEVVEPTFDWLFMFLWMLSEQIPQEKMAAMHAVARPTPPLHKPDDYPEAFARAGFVDLQDVRTEQLFDYDDEAHYWRWLDSTVAPWYFEWLDAEHLGLFKAMVSEGIQQFAQDGKLRIPGASRSFIARKG
jgi:O-methyltransferase/aklanonic acid methyltransferase